MSCRLEPVGATTWQFCPDELPAIGDRLRALVGARLIDEITRETLQTSQISTPDQRLALHVVARVAGDGIVGLAGRPARLFPDLATAAAPLAVHVAAAGYLPIDLADTLGPFVGFPDVFVPIDHGDLLMHRIGVAFTGRVVQRGTPANTPLAGAAVDIAGLWSTYPPANVLPNAVIEPPRIVALTPGFYGSHLNATLTRCDFVVDLPQTKRLLLPAPAGTQRLRLDNRQTLTVGMPLQIDPIDAGRREVIGIAAIDTSLSDDQPAWVELDYPLQQLHRQNAQTTPASVPASHDPQHLTRAALAGDPIAFLNAIAPWPDLSLIQVDDGVSPLEYQWIEHYATVADADGYFRLPRLSRIALFRLRATHPTPPQPLLLTIEPDYTLAEQDLSVAFE